MAVVGDAINRTLEAIGINGVQAGVQAKVSPGANRVSIPSDQDWLADPYAYECVVKAATMALQLFKPSGDVHDSAAAKATTRPDAWFKGNVADYVVTPIARELAGVGHIDSILSLDRIRPLLSGLSRPDLAKVERG